jgi:Protein of unknown function (DUF1573)
MKKRVLSIFILASFGFLVSCKKEVTQVPPSTGIAPVETTTTTPSIEATEPVSAPILEKAAPIPVDKLAEMTFDKENHDFGTINQGEKPEYTFVFKNTSKNDLLITNAVGSCGCTVPEYPKEAVKPGQTSKIKVSFNSDGKSGKQEKSVTITANVANESQIIRIKANIIAKK